MEVLALLPGQIVRSTGALLFPLPFSSIFFLFRFSLSPLLLFSFFFSFPFSPVFLSPLFFTGSVLVTVLSMDSANLIDSRMSRVVAFIVEAERCIDGRNKKQDQRNETRLPTFLICNFKGRFGRFARKIRFDVHGFG